MRDCGSPWQDSILQLAPPVMGGEIEFSQIKNSGISVLQLAPPVMGGEILAFLPGRNR